MSEPTFASIAIGRRAVAIALFAELHLSRVLFKDLMADETKAADALTAFIRHLVFQYQIQSAVMETPTLGRPRVTQLYVAAEHALRLDAVPYWRSPLHVVLQSYAIPPLRRRQQVREVAATLWPAVVTERHARLGLDSAALGLSTQIDHLLGINNENE